MKHARYMLVILLATSFAAPYAHAQNIPATNDLGSAPATDTTGGATGIPGSSGIGTFGSTGDVQPVTVTGANGLDANGNIVQAPSSVPTGTSASGPAAATPVKGINFGEDPLAYLMSKLMVLFAWLLGIAAITLDNAMYYTVVHMGDYIHGLSAVGVAWRILRDIGNVILIFGFIVLGIEVILDINIYGGGTKLLPKLLIVAVLLNFSLFIAEAVVDVGNLFATEFYTQINNGQPAAPQDYGGQAISNEGISHAVMNQIGLQSIYDSGVNGSDGSLIFHTGTTFVVGFMAILLFMIAAFVFFSLAFVIIARFVVLILLIIAAPIGFAGLIVPKLDSVAKQWWGALISQTLTAPIMLLMLYVALAVITDAQFLTGFNVAGSDSAASNAAQSAWLAWAGNPAQLGSLASIILSFVVAMGLLLAVTFLSKKMGAIGGAAATKWAGAASFGVTAGALGIAGRNTLGWGATAGARSFKNSSLSRVPLLGRAISNRLDKTAKSTFDLRNSALAGAAGGAKALGLDIGKGTKANYFDTEKKAIEDREKYAKSLGKNASEKAAEAEAKGAKATAEKNLKETRAQNESAMRSLMAQHAVELRPFNEAVDRDRKALAEAQKTGNQQNINAAQLAFNNSLRDQEKQRAEQQKQQAELKAVHDKLVKVQEEEVKAHQDNIDTINRAPQLGYAAGLTWGPGNLLYKNKKAADNIKTTATKSKAQKDSDKIFELLEKAAKDKEGGGEKKEEKKDDAH